MPRSAWPPASPLAHKASDSYLQLAAAPGQLDVRWDIALRDLDVALDLDSNADGKLTWGEVQRRLAEGRGVRLAATGHRGCPLAPVGPRPRAPQRRRLCGAESAFVMHAGGSAANLVRRSSRDVDPTHRGIAKVQRPASRSRCRCSSRTRRCDPVGTVASGGERIARGVGVRCVGTADVGSGRWEFLGEGVRHILTGYDHVLFLLCLLLPAVLRRTPRGWQPVERLSQAVLPVVGIVSAFTVAHSITLGLAALKLVSLPSSFIEPAIAATIVLAALDNVLPIFPVRRVVVTFFFGLIHGFGFAGVLAELNLPRADFAWALLQFNLGLEVGQLVIVVIATSVLFGLRRWRATRAG